jgi:hypothetical protein
MKKIILFIMFWGVYQLTFSQYPSIFGTTSTSWNMLVKEHNIPRLDSLVVRSDTTINSKTYKQIDVYSIRSSTSTLFFPKQLFIREDTTTGKVWCLGKFSSSELLVSNMTLNVNDTMYFSADSTFYAIVDNISYSGGKKHIRLNYFPHLNCTEISSEKYTMIEGVGITNFLNTTAGIGFCDMLLCKRTNGIMSYQNTSPAYSGYCNSRFVDVSNTLYEKSILLYPNPTDNIIKIKNNDVINISSVKVISSNGKTIVDNYNYSIQSIDVSSYEKGIYFIVFETEKGDVYKKVVVN